MNALVRRPSVWNSSLFSPSTLLTDWAFWCEITASQFKNTICSISAVGGLTISQSAPWTVSMLLSSWVPDWVDNSVWYQTKSAWIQNQKLHFLLQYVRGRSLCLGSTADWERYDLILNTGLGFPLAASQGQDTSYPLFHNSQHNFVCISLGRMISACIT